MVNFYRHHLFIFANLINLIQIELVNFWSNININIKQLK